MMDIFVVCFLQVSCSWLIQLAEVYINWYMMWYLKRYVLQGTYLFLMMHHFLNGQSIICFWTVWLSSISLAIIRHPADTFHMELVHEFCMCFCMHASSHEHTHCTHDLFGRSRNGTPDLAAWSFCGSRVWFPGPDHLFQACTICGLCHSPPWLEDQVGLQKNKTYMRKKSY